MRRVHGRDIQNAVRVLTHDMRCKTGIQTRGLVPIHVHFDLKPGALLVTRDIAKFL